MELNATQVENAIKLDKKVNQGKVIESFVYARCAYNDQDPSYTPLENWMLVKTATASDFSKAYLGYDSVEPIDQATINGTQPSKPTEMSALQGVLQMVLPVNHL